MTIEEAHIWLEDKQRLMTQNRWAFSSNDIEANGMAILALEKQMPKSWIMKTNFIEETIWECPSCNEEFVLIKGDVNDNSYYYCPNCGQALDWSE